MARDFLGRLNVSTDVTHNAFLATLLDSDRAIVSGYKDLASAVTLAYAGSDFDTYYVKLEDLGETFKGFCVIHDVALGSDTDFSGVSGAIYTELVVNVEPPDVDSVAATVNAASAAAALNVHLSEISDSKTFKLRRRTDGYFHADRVIPVRRGEQTRLWFNFESDLDGHNVATVESVAFSGSGVTLVSGEGTKLNGKGATPKFDVDPAATLGEQDITVTVTTSAGETFVGTGTIRVNA